MKTRIINILIAALGLAAVGGGQSAFAQLATTQTTLSSAILAGGGGTVMSSGQWCVASATGIVLPSISTAGSYLVSGKEAAQVTAQGSSATCFTVKRGQLGSLMPAHNSGDVVWVGNAATGTGDNSRPFSGGVITRNVPAGPCVSSQQYSLPVIILTGSNSALDGAVGRCIGGQWQTGQGQGTSNQPFTAFSTPQYGIAGVSVTDVNGTIWFSQLFAPTNATITGACVLNGATVATDKWILALYDSAGVLMANTATAGTTTAGASLYQCIPFVSTVAITGPNSYFAALQGNGTTDNFLAYKTGGAPLKFGTQSQTGTFGTLPAMTTPTTTFTTAKGPQIILY